MAKRSCEKMAKLNHRDFYCANLHCDYPLTQYELDRQTRGWRYRFCRNCRINITSGRGCIEWKCLSCDTIMSHGAVIGMYFCSRKCKEKKRVKRKMLEYRMDKLIKDIKEQGGIEKYKTNRQFQPIVS